MSVLHLGIAAGAVALITGMTLAQAQAPAFPARGPDCGSVIAQFGPRGVWMGRFSGGREVTVSMFLEREGIQTYSAEACFRTRAECDRWLYALNTQFQDRPILSVCQRLRG
jgi:hypothetical protein